MQDLTLNSVHDDPVDHIQQAALRLMAGLGIEAVCLDVPAESETAMNTTLRDSPWIYARDVQQNPLLAKMVLRALERGPAAVWKPRRNLYYRPQKGQK